MKKEKINLFGLNIDNVTVRDALARVRRLLDGGGQTVVFTPNLQMLDAARKSKAVRKMLNRADLLLPDGSSLLLISKMLGKGLSSVTPGIEFGEALLSLAARRGLRVFLLGGQRGVAPLAAKMLKKKLKNLCICGTHHGYIEKVGQKDALIKKINESRADILLVCMGFPRQERFILQNKASLSGVKVFAALGGSLDVWSGEVRRAPKIFRQAHAEWLWRIAREPSRMPRFFSSLSTLGVAYLYAVGRPSQNFSNSASVGLKSRRGAYNQTERI